MSEIPENSEPITAENPSAETIAAPSQMLPVMKFREDMQRELGKVIVGQHKLSEELLVTILANGHALLEGVPGVAKTLIAKTIARLLNIEFRRIQFTPDLMPSDIVGTKIFDFSSSAFKIQKGPVFSNIVLIDEVNRAPAKTQSALLEVMEERQVTIEGETFILSDPFLVLATQNPVEFEGTYSLPEAQMDRFLMKINVDYPNEEEELEILNRFNSGALSLGKSTETTIVLNPVANAAKLSDLRNLVGKVLVEPGILSYINKIVRATRNHPFLFMGSSPRGNISLLSAVKALAALRGRDYVNPDDVKELTAPVLRHRVILSPEAELEGLNTDQVLKEIAEQTLVPR